MTGGAEALRRPPCPRPEVSPHSLTTWSCFEAWVSLFLVLSSPLSRSFLSLLLLSSRSAPVLQGQSHWAPPQTRIPHLLLPEITCPHLCLPITTTIVSTSVEGLPPPVASIFNHYCLSPSHHPVQVCADGALSGHLFSAAWVLHTLQPKVGLNAQHDISSPASHLPVFLDAHRSRAATFPFESHSHLPWGFPTATQYASKFGKLSSDHRTGKGQFSFQPKERQCQSMFKLLHNYTHLTC